MLVLELVEEAAVAHGRRAGDALQAGVEDAHITLLQLKARLVGEFAREVRRSRRRLLHQRVDAGADSLLQRVEERAGPQLGKQLPLELGRCVLKRVGGRELQRVGNHVVEAERAHPRRASPTAAVGARGGLILAVELGGRCGGGLTHARVSARAGASKQACGNRCERVFRICMESGVHLLAQRALEVVTFQVRGNIGSTHRGDSVDTSRTCARGMGMSE